MEQHELAAILQHEEELLTSLPRDDVVLRSVDHEEREIGFPQGLNLFRAHKVTPAL